MSMSPYMLRFNSSARVQSVECEWIPCKIVGKSAGFEGESFTRIDAIAEGYSYERCHPECFREE